MTQQKTCFSTRIKETAQINYSSRSAKLDDANRTTSKMFQSLIVLGRKEN